MQPSRGVKQWLSYGLFYLRFTLILASTRAMFASLLKRTVVQLMPTFVLIVVAVVGYAFFAESRAETKARDFCRSVPAGQATEGLVERALAAGANKRMTRWIKVHDTEDWLPITFSGSTPLSRHICSVSATANRVTQTDYVCLD